jgi:hypothetical protein
MRENRNKHKNIFVKGKGRVLYDPLERKAGIKWGGYYDIKPCMQCGQYFGEEDSPLYKYCSLECQINANRRQSRERMRKYRRKE